jgi:hypothetical protein
VYSLIKWHHTLRVTNLLIDPVVRLAKMTASNRVPVIR